MEYRNDSRVGAAPWVSSPEPCTLFVQNLESEIHRRKAQDLSRIDGQHDRSIVDAGDTADRNQNCAAQSPNHNRRCPISDVPDVGHGPDARTVRTTNRQRRFERPFDVDKRIVGSHLLGGFVDVEEVASGGSHCCPWSGLADVFGVVHHPSPRRVILTDSFVSLSHLRQVCNDAVASPQTQRRFFEYRAIAEIADELAMSTGSVKSSLSRALHQLRLTSQLREAQWRAVNVKASARGVDSARTEERQSSMTSYQASEADLRKLVDAQATVIDLLGPNAPFIEFLTKLCGLFGEQIPGSTVSILLPTADGSSLTTGIGLPAESDDQTQEISIAEGSGASGTAAFRRETVICADIATDPLWERWRTSAPNASIRAAWAEPLFGQSREVVGVLTVLWPDPKTPEPRETWLMDHFSRMTAKVIERYRMQQSMSQVLADERRAIAQDLHDDPIQAVTAASLRVQRLVPSATDEQRTKLADIQSSLSGAIERMRSMLFELHPPTLDDEGLASAVELYLYERLDPVGIAWTLEDRIQVTPSAATQSLAYRLTREALSNVAHHSKASTVTVTLETGNDGLHVCVVDDGVGCDIDTALHGRAGHLGTVSSRHLAQRASGRWKIDSNPGEGTTVEFWVPTGLLS